MKEWPEEDDHLTFAGGEGGMGDLRKKILHTDFEGKDSCTEIPGEENIFHVVRWKKILTPLYV